MDDQKRREILRRLYSLIEFVEGGDGPSRGEGALGELNSLKITTKQHAIIQLLIKGVSAEDSGRILGVSQNTVRTQLRQMRVKANVAQTTQLRVMMETLFDQVEPSEYQKLSGGLPKDWAWLSEDKRKPYEKLLRPIKPKHGG
ncbi:MAG: LuxR C-terminal-related transcriptional regulator [Pseudomonadota bacterium]